MDVRILVMMAGLALAPVSGCNREDGRSADVAGGVRVSEIDLGRSINPDRTIDDDTTSFKPTDTIYTSVETEGSAKDATLTARWSYEDGQRVDEASKTISPSGTAHTEFQISKPSGWPEGKYKVEVMLNGQPAGTEEFEVSR
jgi:hypothetical protein